LLFLFCEKITKLLTTQQSEIEIEIEKRICTNLASIEFEKWSDVGFTHKQTKFNLNIWPPISSDISGRNIPLKNCKVEKEEKSFSEESGDKG
jgi:hypothetical protein